MLLYLPSVSSPDPVVVRVRSMVARGRHTEADRFAQDHCRRVGAAAGPMFLAVRAEIALALGRFSAAWQFAREAAHRVTTPGALSIGIENLKIRALLGLGRFREAERQISLGSPDPGSVERHLFRATVAFHAGRWSEAAEAAANGHDRALASGQRVRLIEALQLRARIAREGGQRVRARVDLDRASRLSQGLRDATALAGVLSDRADLLAHDGEWEEAANNARQSARLFARSLSPHEHLSAGRRTGLLGLAKGDPAGALPAIERAADVARRGFGAAECRAEIDLLLADAQLAGKDPEGALERATAALASFRDAQDPRGLARARVRRSLAALSAANHTLALREAKLAGLVEGGGPVAQGLADLALGRVLLRSNPGAASSSFERASGNCSVYPPLQCVARLGLALSAGASPESDSVRQELRALEEFGDFRILAIVRSDLKEAFGLESAAVIAGPVSFASATAVPSEEFAMESEFLPGLLGASSAVRQVGAEIRKAAPSDLPVSIHGETGTGKEKIARAIHDFSRRSAKEFVAFNAASLSDELFESELFGHARGSFTGAHSDRPGLVESARGGTLFIDEIADLSPRAQVRLLRFIQEGSYRRVGENHERRADVRIVVAANQPLEALVASGRFRNDLFQRIKGLRVVVPPLRERGQDVLNLARHFVRRAGGGERRLSRRSEAEVQAYHWPGNVRELEMEMRRAVIMAEASEVEWRRPGTSNLPGPPPALPGAGRSLREAMDGFERHVLKSTLEQCAERSAAARMLGISRQSLHQKIVRYGL